MTSPKTEEVYYKLTEPSCDLIRRTELYATINARLAKPSKHSKSGGRR